MAAEFLRVVGRPKYKAERVVIGAGPAGQRVDAGSWRLCLGGARGLHLAATMAMKARMVPQHLPEWCGKGSHDAPRRQLRLNGLRQRQRRGQDCDEGKTVSAHDASWRSFAPCPRITGTS